MDNRLLEKKALERFRVLCENAPSVQEELLLRLLHKNSQTEYGRLHGFSEIHSLKDYQSRVPLSDFSDFSDYVERTIAGEKNLLTAEQPVFYCISSGNEGTPKYIPIVEEDIQVQKRYELDMIMEDLRQELGEYAGPSFPGKVFQTYEFFKTFMPDGTMSGVRSGAYPRWLESRGEMETSWYTPPREVLFPEKVEDLQYVKCRFALEDRDISAIHGVFVHRVVGLFYYILKNWEKLLRDMETGTVDGSFAVSERWKRYLEQKLPPNPARAAELGRLPYRELKKNMVLKIWPKLRYVRLVGGSIFASQMEELREFIGELPVHYFAYASSESNLAIGQGIHREDAFYTLIPEAGFFEFIPENEDPARPLTMEGVEAGKRYELVITTLSGLYRYIIGDVVEVAGFKGRSPVVRVCYRKGQELNAADERMNARQLEKAMHQFALRAGMGLEGYCVDIDLKQYPPSYINYIETRSGDMPQDGEELLDQYLKDSCFGYKSGREVNEIGRVVIKRLRRGSFGKYWEWLEGQGYRMEQNKPLHIVKTAEQRKFFQESVSQ